MFTQLGHLLGLRCLLDQGEIHLNLKAHYQKPYGQGKLSNYLEDYRVNKGEQKETQESRISLWHPLGHDSREGCPSNIAKNG